MLVGVLGLQGDVIEHVNILKKIPGEREVRVVKNAAEISTLNALVIPGGESTTIGKLIQKNKIDAEIKRRNLPIFGTCAGTIMLAKEIDIEQFSLKLMDIKVERNAYGRQKESFETELEIPALGEKLFKAIFIRAPAIRNAGKGVEVLAEFEGSPVLVRQGNMLACTFHPELTDDVRLHEYFLREIAEVSVVSRE